MGEPPKVDVRGFSSVGSGFPRVEILILGDDGPAAPGEVGEIMGHTAEEFMVQLNEVASPYQFRIYDRVSFPVEQQLPSFMECAERFNLVEPISRIKRTLEVLKCLLIRVLRKSSLSCQKRIV